MKRRAAVLGRAACALQGSEQLHFQGSVDTFSLISVVPTSVILRCSSWLRCGWILQVLVAMCTQPGSAIYLTAGVEAVVAQRFFIADSEAVSSAWGQGCVLTGSNKAIFLPQPWSGRSAWDADQQLSFTWVPWNKLDSFKAKWKNVPSMFGGRPQRSACSSYACASP